MLLYFSDRAYTTLIRNICFTKTFVFLWYVISKSMLKQLFKKNICFVKILAQYFHGIYATRKEKQMCFENICFAIFGVNHLTLQQLFSPNKCFFYFSTKPLHEDTTLSQEENISFYKTYVFWSFYFYQSFDSNDSHQYISKPTPTWNQNKSFITQHSKHPRYTT